MFSVSEDQIEVDENRMQLAFAEDNFTTHSNQDDVIMPALQTDTDDDTGLLSFYCPH